MKSSKVWILLIVGLFLISLVATVMISVFSRPAAMAKVYFRGECIQQIDLSAVAIPYSFQVQGENITNTIRVEHGRICVEDADCPDRICVHTGWIRESGIPIVCLPNQLVVEISGAETLIDGVSK